MILTTVFQVFAVVKGHDFIQQNKLSCFFLFSAVCKRAFATLECQTKSVFFLSPFRHHRAATYPSWNYINIHHTISMNSMFQEFGLNNELHTVLSNAESRTNSQNSQKPKEGFSFISIAVQGWVRQRQCCCSGSVPFQLQAQGQVMASFSSAAHIWFLFWSYWLPKMFTFWLWRYFFKEKKE